jgi:hypothetical protein
LQNLRRGFGRIFLETSIPGAADTKPILDYAGRRLQL